MLFTKKNVKHKIIIPNAYPPIMSVNQCLSRYILEIPTAVLHKSIMPRRIRFELSLELLLTKINQINPITKIVSNA